MAFMREPLYILMQDGVVEINDPTADPREYTQHWTTSQDLFDNIVVMRWHNMTEEERKDAEKRVLETQFETGADGIRQFHGLSTVSQRVDDEMEEKGHGRPMGD